MSERVIPGSAKQFKKVSDKDGLTLWYLIFYQENLHS